MRAFGAVLVLVAAQALLAPRPAAADLVTADAATLLSPRAQTAVTGLAFEPVPLLEVGYVRSLPGPWRERAIDVGASLQAPLFLIPRARDLRLVASARLPAVVGGRFQLGLALSTFFATATDSLATSRAFGFAASATPRYVATRWFLGARIEARATPLLHLSNTDFAGFAYADRYDHGATNAPDPGLPRTTGPRDGWYAWTSGRVLSGLEFGRRLGARVAVTGNAGVWWAPQSQGLYFAIETGQIPLYARLDVHVAF